MFSKCIQTHILNHKIQYVLDLGTYMYVCYINLFEFEGRKNIWYFITKMQSTYL